MELDPRFRWDGTWQTARAEDLYWSSDPEAIAELKARCHSTFERFGRTWGAIVMPLLDSQVLVTRAGEPGRLVQAFADIVRVILAAGTPHSRVLTIHPQEVLLPWNPDHQFLFDRAGRRFPERSRSSTASSAGSTSSPTVQPARPTVARTEEPAGPMSLL